MEIKIKSVFLVKELLLHFIFNTTDILCTQQKFRVLDWM